MARRWSLCRSLSLSLPFPLSLLARGMRVCTDTQIHGCICMHARTHARARTHVNVHPHARMHACTHARTHAHTTYAGCAANATSRGGPRQVADGGACTRRSLGSRPLVGQCMCVCVYVCVCMCVHVCVCVCLLPNPGV
jgi:hypothetical protein